MGKDLVDEWWSELNDRELKFVAMLCANGRNQTQAALYAGYGNGDPAQAAVYANKLLKKDKVADAVAKLRQKEVIDPTIADVTELKRFWSKKMRGDAESEAGELKASEYLARCHGIFVDKKEIPGGGRSVAVVLYLPDSGRDDDDENS